MGGQWVLCAPSHPHVRQAEGPCCPENTRPEAAVTSACQSSVTSASGREQDTLEGQQGQTLLGAHVTAPKRGLGWGSRFPHPVRLQGTVGTPDPGHSLEVLGSQPIPEHTQHSAVMPLPRLPGKPNPCPSRGCRAPTARGQPAPPGKSLVRPFFPAASGGLQCPAHSQSLAPPPWMTHSSIWSVFTL